MDVNRTTVAGRVVRDPDYCTTTSGLPVCAITVASSRHWTSASGEKREETLFLRCSAFGKTAEGFKKWLVKGTEVFIEGYLHNNEYTSKTGEKRTSTELVVEKWQPCSWDQAKALLASRNGTAQANSPQMPTFSPYFSQQNVPAAPMQQNVANVPLQQMTAEQRFSEPRVDDADVPLEDLPF